MRFTSFKYFLSKVSTIEVCKIHLVLSICNKNAMVLNFQQLQVISIKIPLVFSYTFCKLFFVPNINCRYGMWKRKILLKFYFVAIALNFTQKIYKSLVVIDVWTHFECGFMGGDFVPKFHSCVVCKRSHYSMFFPTIGSWILKHKVSTSTFHLDALIQKI
jgi:hypothetical protein